VIVENRGGGTTIHRAWTVVANPFPTVTLCCSVTTTLCYQLGARPQAQPYDPPLKDTSDFAFDAVRHSRPYGASTRACRSETLRLVRRLGDQADRARALRTSSSALSRICGGRTAASPAQSKNGGTSPTRRGPTPCAMFFWAAMWPVSSIRPADRQPRRRRPGLDPGLVVASAERAAACCPDVGRRLPISS